MKARLNIFWLTVIAGLMVPVSFVVYVLWHFCIPCTQYSSNYNEEAFQSIRIGQTLPEVLEKLGPPYRVVPPYLEMWKYEWGAVFLGDDGTAEVEQLFDWDRETIRKNMGKLPSNITVESLSEMSRDSLMNTLGSPKEIIESAWGNDRLYFYTHAASGGMWSDRTWKKRVLYVDLRTHRISSIISTWMVVGDPVG